MEKLISQSEFARRKNCSKQYVSQLVRSGRITLVNGKIDPVLAEKQIQQTADPNHPKNLNKEESGNYNRVYNQAKTKILYLEGKIEKVKFELRTGLRIPIQDVEQSLDLSVLTAESLHGRPQVRLDASFFWTESSVPVLLTLERRLDVI